MCSRTLKSLHFGVNKITKTISIMMLLDSKKPVTSLTPEATDAPDTTGSVGITADLYQIALGLIVSILSDDFSSRFTVEEETSLRRTRQRLFLWGDGHSILAGRMDEALEQATDLRSIVIATLRSIIKLVYLGLWFHSTRKTYTDIGLSLSRPICQPNQVP
jgi:hypothetical protein